MKTGQLLPALAASAALALGVWTAPASAQDDGFYLGILGGVLLEGGDSGPVVSKLVGFNVVNGDLVLGAEGEALANYWIDDTWYGLLSARGRVGLQVTDDLLLYGTAGFGVWSSNVTATMIGGGGEFGLGDAWSGRIDVQGLLYGGGDTGVLARGGVVWHPY